MFSLLMGRLSWHRRNRHIPTERVRGRHQGGRHDSRAISSADNDFRHWGVVLSKPYDHAPAVRAAKRR